MKSLVRRPLGVAGGFILAVVGAFGAVFPASPLARLDAAGQTFRSSIDLIAVDVQVIDRSGKPVQTLGPDNFTVTLDGQRRRVVSVNLAQYDVTSPSMSAAADGAAPLNPLSATGPTGNGRTFIIAVDTASFRAGETDAARLAAERFTRGLLPDDAIGVLTLPYGPYLEPTTSHVTARQAISRIVGRKAATSQFDMSIEQMVDITAAAANQSILESRQTVGRMVSNTVNDDVASDIPVECAGTKIACTEAAISEAGALATALEGEVLQGIQGLDGLLRQLQATPVRKTVLLLSAGMPVSDRSGGRPSIGREVRMLGERAAYANATIHTMYFDQNIVNEFAVETRRPKSSTGRSRIINTRALAEFTEPSGGALMEVKMGVGEKEIDRLLREISTYYVLGVEPDASDRDGRPHRLQVKVGVRDVQIRSREVVIVPRGT